jgi:hypothetical protein
MTRTADELRFATRRLMRKYRVLVWQPRPTVKADPAFVPEWLRRGAFPKDFTGTTAL